MSSIHVERSSEDAGVQALLHPPWAAQAWTGLSLQEAQAGVCSLHL